MPHLDYKRIRATYGGTWLKTGEIELDPEFLNLIGQTLVDIIETESKNEFIKRDWSHNDPMGGPPIGQSFKFEVLGDRTIVLKSSYYGLAELTSPEGIPERRMTWLTQQGAKRRMPDKRYKKGYRPSSTNASPLVVPLTTKEGEVIFRMAPLRMAEAWIHPGIARFTFVQRALKKARLKIADMVQEYCGNVISAGIAKALSDD